LRKEWLDYRYSDGNMYFSFCFCDVSLIKGWKIQIVEPVDYQSRDTSGHATHRLFYDNDYDCICWEGRISSLEKAKAVARIWADATSMYISGEGTFDTIAAQLMKE